MKKRDYRKFEFIAGYCLYIGRYEYTYLYVSYRTQDESR